MTTINAPTETGAPTQWGQRLKTYDGVQKLRRDLVNQGSLTVMERENILQLVSTMRMPTPKETVELSMRLMGCYQARDFFNVEVFTAALAAHFASKPFLVGWMVTDPLTGLPSKSKWCPSIEELSTALDKTNAMMEAVGSRLSKQLGDKPEPMPEPEKTPEQRAEMQERLKGLAASLRSVPSD